jgi:hypothetical protein
VAVVLMLLCDGFIGVCTRLIRRLRTLPAAA